MWGRRRSQNRTHSPRRRMGPIRVGELLVISATTRNNSSGINSRMNSEKIDITVRNTLFEAGIFSITSGVLADWLNHTHDDISPIS